MPDFLGWAFSDLTTTGPDPFSSNASANSSAAGASTITVNAPGQIISMTDNDSDFTDGDSTQRYYGPADFNGGVGFDVGDRIETEYSYVIRPSGSSDPADNITIYMLEIDADGQGIAADKPLYVGVTYDIIAVDSSNPTVAYSSLYVCFASGTQISTPQGLVKVEDLVAGQMVDTLDEGAQRLVWAGTRKIDLRGAPLAHKPVKIKRGALTDGLPRNDLIVSPQHRIMVMTDEGERLVAAKALLALPGVRQMRGLRSVTYHALLFARHQVVLAEGAAAESLLPGPVALSVLHPRERSEVFRLFPFLAGDAAHRYGPPARPILKQRHVAQRLRQSAPAARHPEGACSATSM